MQTWATTWDMGHDEDTEGEEEETVDCRVAEPEPIKVAFHVPTKAKLRSNNRTEYAEAASAARLADTLPQVSEKC